MTTLDYLTSDAMKSEVNVLQCLTLEDASIGVILDRTLFHVQGGGQPSDVGFIGEAQVLKVVRTEMGIVHLVDREIDEGPVTIEVDKELRLLHSRLHSAGHLIGASLEGKGWTAIKGSHQPGQCRVIGAKSDENAAVPEKEAIEAQVNAWMAQGYTKITFSVSFTASADINKVIAYGPTAGWLIDETGNATWTVTLGADSPIDFWVQTGDTPSTGAFTISNITLA